MPRFVLKKAKNPYELKPQAKPVHICMCGLSKNQPFCDGSHLKTVDEKEDEVYMYDQKTGKRIIEEDDCCCGDEQSTCGEDCCGSHSKDGKKNHTK